MTRRAAQAACPDLSPDRQQTPPIGNLGNVSSSAHLQTVGRDICNVGQATESLFTQLKTSCGY